MWHLAAAIGETVSARLLLIRPTLRAEGGQKFRDIERTVAIDAVIFCAAPLQKYLGELTDSDWIGKQPEAHRAALSLVEQGPAKCEEIGDQSELREKAA
jgi:hypothetical protein